VVAPNYRLAPQVSGRDAFADSVEAFDWATTQLPALLQNEHDVELDKGRVVAFGHSTGGTIAMHLASTKPVKAVTAFYPSLFLADIASSAHQPCVTPPLGTMPDFTPNGEDWTSINPAGMQVSEAPLAAPDTTPPPRNLWHFISLRRVNGYPRCSLTGNSRPSIP
jgi:acetyl esterase/lipase